MNSKSNANLIYYSINSFIEKYYFIFFTLIMLVIGYICFKNLGALPVQDWDEARHGVSAYEMFKNNDYVVNTYNYSNDYWNLKPPMSFWAIIMFFKIFGVSIFSMRLYSAVSMFITICIVGLFMKKRYGRLEALISLVLFAASSPLYLSHMGRSGDADAMFVLFFTLSMLSMMCIKKTKKALYLSGFFFSLAFLTKSWHAFSIVAIGGLFLIFSGEIRKLKIKQWILFISSFVVPISGWIVARIYKDGTYFLTEMVRYDLLERSKNPLEGHTGSVWFYFKSMLYSNRVLMITLIVVMAISLILYYRDIKIKEYDTIALILWIVVPFAVFTYAKTKIAWYILPVYIPLYIVVARAIGKIMKDRRTFSFIKLIVIILILGVSAKEINFNISAVRNPSTELVQNFISKNVSENKEILSLNAYIEIENNQWSQGRLLVAEFSADLLCKNGGIEEFMREEESSIIIISEDNYNKNKDTVASLEILSQDNGLYLLKNR
ncbi:ArnT family glycosyltransferase [Clostridium intestinale]|uniref:Glycosyltransferase family 39 protein n=1 Tax=Clostridium intestinale TaxID=36845 RepID=A0A7D6VQ35_9CLOT|nr:glycosyltransferase family 39 protein [Clostridium intestinale]QLY79089.1 glycosyltransferase family 39 protein [Clostridium intestinale]